MNFTHTTQGTTKEGHAFARPSLFGMPDWSRTSGLQSRSYQAVKGKGCIHASFGASAQILPHLAKSGQALVRQRLARF